MIVVLQYSPNTCYTQVVSLEEAKQNKDLQIDLKAKTWTYEGRKREFRQSRIPHEQRYGVIGIFDTDKLDELNSMVSAAKEATEEHNYWMED